MSISRRLLLFGIALAASLYLGVFIYRTSVLVEGHRYFVLFDDAMISMRYAKNLAAGDGLVWNPGEYVEGYTNPLWVLYMTAWHLVGLSPPFASLPIQITGALALLLNLVIVGKIAGRISHDAGPVVVGAVFLAAFYYPLNYWAVVGMEVGVLTPLIGLAVWWALSGVRNHREAARLYFLLGVGTLVRLDIAVPYLSILGIAFLLDRNRRRLHLAWGLSLLLLFIGLQTGLRLWYYGEWLPNTYYLKMQGFPALLRIARGAVAFTVFVLHLNPLVFLIPVATVLLRRSRELLILGTVFAGQVAYSIYVGGDAWEWNYGSNRFYSIVMPLLLILCCEGFWRATQRAQEALSGEDRSAAASLWVLGLGVVLGVLWCTALLSNATESSSPSLRALAMAVMIVCMLLAYLLWQLRVPFRERGAQAVFTAAVLAFLANLNGHLTTTQGQPSSSLWLGLSPPAIVDDAKNLLIASRQLSRITTREATIAIAWAGILPYFTDRSMIDLLGKCEPVIAHGIMKSPHEVPSYLVFLPGHMKWDYGYSIGQKQPDVVVNLWPGKSAIAPAEEAPKDAQPFLSGAYAAVIFPGNKLFIRKASTHIRWDEINQDHAASCPH